MGFSGISRSLVDISGNLMSVEFGGILGLVESGGFLGRGVDIGGNLRLVDLSGFPRFQFGVRAVRRRTFLSAVRGSK